MKRKKIKLIFFINTYSDYLGDFISSIKFLFDIKVILLNLNTKNTYYKNLTDKEIYHTKCDYNVIKEFKKYDPDFVIIGGYRNKFVSELINICTEKNIKYLFWMERINLNFYLKSFLFKIFYKNRLKNSDGILAIGNQAVKFFRKFNNNTYLFPYNIDVKQFKKSKLQNKIKLLYVGQLIPRKGIISILNSFNFLEESVLENIECTFVGNGSLKKKIFNKIKEYTFIKLVNFKSRKELIKIYSQNNILIFPSKYDGWGVVPMEAMSSKMTLIISKNCGIAEYLTNKKNAVVVNPNPKDISKAIRYYFYNQSKIDIHGENNLKLIKKSLMNSKNSSKLFFSIINKLNSNEK